MTQEVLSKWLKHAVVGFRDDMSDVQAWRKFNERNEPITYQEWYRRACDWMSGKGPSPYTDD